MMVNGRPAVGATIVLHPTDGQPFDSRGTRPQATVGPDPRQPFVLRNTRVWDSHWAFHCGSPCVRIEGMAVHDCFYGLWRCVMHRHEHRGLAFSDVDTPVFFPRASGEADYAYKTDECFDLDPIDDRPR